MLTYFFVTLVGTLLVPGLVNADDPGALWIEPSSKWYGIDGNWSSITLFAGQPAQEVDVIVSTSLSEIWVVENGGCGNNALCTAARGGVYDIGTSHSWSPLGAWQLGMEYVGIEGNGDYAMETIAIYDSKQRSKTSFGQQVVAGINDTNPYTGFFGLGVTPGRFKDYVAQSPITSLVEQDGVIPSHSYGYTAGAYYGGSKGTPLSLTLGGYDANRFEPHDTKFSLNATTRQPEVLVRSITASVSDAGEAPTSWSSPSTPLLAYNESTSALLDSSTPYLWLPASVCDRFAYNLNLTWNETLELYLFPDNNNLDRFKSSPDLSFTFSLTSADNRDDFGQPLEVAGLVNITISANAFVQSLRYPFMNAIEYGAPAVPYFPLKKADDDSGIIIGRAFFQEAYLIMNYETSTFSVHKAKFPDNSSIDTSIQTIAYSGSSPYPGPPGQGGTAGLKQGQIAGLAVGLCFLCIAAILGILFTRRRKRRQPAPDNVEMDYKDNESLTDSEPPRTPVSRMVSKMSKNCPIKKIQAARKGNEHQVSEFPADPSHECRVYEFPVDPSHERFEMPGLGKPAELDVINNPSAFGVANANNRESHRTNTYELEQNQRESQRHELMSEYVTRTVDPPAPVYQDVSSMAHYPPLDHVTQSQSSAASPTRDNLSRNTPSPMTLESDWATQISELPSSMGFVPTRTLSHSVSNPSFGYSPSSVNTPNAASLYRSASTAGSSSSSTHPLIPPPASFQRTPNDPSRAAYPGPLPDNARPQDPPPTYRAPGLNERTFAMPPIPASRRASTADTLGSNYTVEEEARAAAVREASHIFGRIDGAEIIHVPQPALNRYSWEQR
ncbi:acid protease [Xylariaceae sp. FL0662B]|nr:acid protease [Xylariaceae sp. FL0662B]